MALNPKIVRLILQTPTITIHVKILKAFNVMMSILKF